MASAWESARNFWLDQLAEQRQRNLPAEVAHFGGNDFRYALLHDVQLGAAGDLPEVHGHRDEAGQVGIVEFVGVAQALVRLQLEVLAAEGMALAIAEVGEGHAELAAD